MGEFGYFLQGGAMLQVSEKRANVAQFCLCEGLGLGHFEPRAQTEMGCTIPGDRAVVYGCHEFSGLTVGQGGAPNPMTHWSPYLYYSLSTLYHLSLVFLFVCCFSVLTSL